MSSRTTWARYRSKRMDVYHPQKRQSILKQNISSWKTIMMLGILVLSFTPCTGCGLACQLNLYRVKNSGTCMHSYRIALEVMTMKLNRTTQWTHKMLLHCGSVLESMLKLWIRAGKIRARVVYRGQMRHKLYLVNRQDRGLSCVSQTHQHKVSKKQDHMDKPHGQKIYK